MGKRILIVDDEQDTLDLLIARLEKSGYAVSTASNADECIEKAIEEKPSAMLLDVLLPGLSGFEVCKRLKENATTKNIPAIIITGLIGESAKQRGLGCGAEYVITKPYDPSDLLAKIESVIRKKSGIDNDAGP